MTPHLITATCLITLTCIIAIKGNSKTEHKWYAVLFVALFIPATFLAYNDLLSRPKPISLEWASTESATVISAVTIEDEAIWLWLQSDDGPRSYVMPWSETKARELHEAQRQARESGQDLIVDKPFGDSEGDIKFYPKPIQPLPEKVVADDNPVVM